MFTLGALTTLFLLALYSSTYNYVTISPMKCLLRSVNIWAIHCFPRALSLIHVIHALVYIISLESSPTLNAMTIMQSTHSFSFSCLLFLSLLLDLQNQIPKYSLDILYFNTKAETNRSQSSLNVHPYLLFPFSVTGTKVYPVTETRKWGVITFSFFTHTLPSSRWPSIINSASLTSPLVLRFYMSVFYHR